MCRLVIAHDYTLMGYDIAIFTRFYYCTKLFWVVVTDRWVVKKLIYTIHSRWDFVVVALDSGNLDSDNPRNLTN